MEVIPNTEIAQSTALVTHCVSGAACLAVGLRHKNVKTCLLYNDLCRARRFDGRAFRIATYRAEEERCRLGCAGRRVGDPRVGD